MTSSKVLLDLNLPDFQADLFRLDASELKHVLTTFRKLRGMDWPTVYKNKGLHWEQIKDAPDRFTIRLSKRSRAVVFRDGSYIRFIALHTDHDGAYGKK